MRTVAVKSANTTTLTLSNGRTVEAVTSANAACACNRTARVLVVSGAVGDRPQGTAARCLACALQLAKWGAATGTDVELFHPASGARITRFMVAGTHRVVS